jgi:hypothetical protein
MEELNLFRGDTVLVKGKKGRWTRQGGREGGREEVTTFFARLVHVLIPFFLPSLPDPY